MRRPWGLAGFGVLFALSVLHASASPTPRQLRDADRYCQFGNQTLKSGNLNKARGLFEKAVKILPEFPDARLGLGHVAMGERSFETALAEYSAARDGYVKFENSLFELQLLHYTQAQDEISKVRDEIRNYLRLTAGRSSQNASLVERRVTELEEIVHQLEMVKAPSLDAGREAPGEVHFFIGNALFNLNRLNEAVEAWETCARKSPKFPLVYNNLAVAYWKQGNIDQARESLARAERLGLPVNPSFKADLDKSASERETHAALSLQKQHHGLPSSPPDP